MPTRWSYQDSPRRWSRDLGPAPVDSVEAASCREPAHEIPSMTRSRGESLTGKADQVFRDSEKLPPALTLKMIYVFLMPASIDYSIISVTQAEGLS